MYSVLLQHSNQSDHLRPRDARAQMDLDAQHDVQFVTTAWYICFALRESVCVVSFVCETEQSEMKVC